ncbi:hypothetical protein DMENIID0001_049150 [Sergentomyia squamirostris]
MNKIILFVFLMVVASSLAEEMKKFKLTMEKVDITTDPEYITAKAVLRTEDGKSVVDVDGSVLQDVESGIFVDIFINTESEPGQFKSLIKAEDIDFCNYDTNNSIGPLIELFLKDIDNFGNIPLKCPIKKGDFHVKNFRISEEKLPPHTPEARYLIESKIHVPKDGNNRHLVYNSKWIALIVKE